MTKQGVKRALERVSQSQGFVTATQFAHFMGIKTADYAKKQFLNGLECVNGKYYFIEVNLTGEWGWLKKTTGCPIDVAIVDILEG